jgi:hypothetical protein
MAESVYLLCVLTSAAIAILLLRGYRRSGERLLLWTGLGFVGLCANNVLVVIDLMLGPNRDLSLVRNLPTLLGGAFVVYGLVWERD